MTQDLTEMMAFAHALANTAGEVIRPLFRTQVAIDAKPDATPVTVADKKAETAMRTMIMMRYPTHGIWGEEFGQHNAGSEYCWVLDPIDGTKSFIMGFPTFTTLVSLTISGAPVLGVIDQPITKERWSGASGKPTLFGSAPVKTRPCADISQASFSTTSPRLFSGGDRNGFEAVQKHVRNVKYGYDGYAYTQVASGNLDIVIESGLQPHDFCTLRPIIEGAGGIITDWHGKKLTLASDGRVLATGDKRVHAQALELLK